LQYVILINTLLQQDNKIALRISPIIEISYQLTKPNKRYYDQNKLHELQAIMTSGKKR